MNIRTRFAPSPTGYLHAGGVRTALFAWLYARRHNGRFILRIEDTDKRRETDGSIKHIMESLGWLGLNWDEGPDKTGQYGPYKQSDRLAVYKQHAQLLVDQGLAYVDPFSTEELDQFRQAAQRRKQPFLYRRHRPAELSAPSDWYGKQPLRFKVPKLKRFTWQDEVRGELSAGEEALDDFIIIKADGYPTYNFAHVVDDQLMAITHVMRGEEFLASVPKFLSLIEAFGWQRPVFATLPPVLNPRGGKKLSKRDGGAKDVLEYRQDGFLPAAVINFLASLGWNDGTEQEVFTVAELIAKFDLNRLQKGGAKFDDQRLIWLSGHHIRRLELADLYAAIDDHFWPSEAARADKDYKLKVLALVQERLKFFGELTGLSQFFFAEPDVNYDALGAKDQIKNRLAAVRDSLAESDFSQSDLDRQLRGLAAQLSLKPGELFSLIRIVVTGTNVSPGLFETLELLGPKRVLTRLDKALA